MGINVKLVTFDSNRSKALAEKPGFTELDEIALELTTLKYFRSFSSTTSESTV